MPQSPLRISIRLADERDTDTIAAIEKESFANPWSAADMRERIGSAGSLATVAELSPEEVAGFVCCRGAGGDMEIHRMAVRPPYRRKGIGEMLCRDIVARARDMAVSAVFLEVARSNAAAQALYAKLGFSQSYVRKGYYAASGGDALVMRLDM